MNRPPWLNTRSTGADVQGVQKTLSSLDFKRLQTNKLFVVPDETPRHTSLSAIKYQLQYAKYEVTTDAMEKS